MTRHMSVVCRLYITQVHMTGSEDTCTMAGGGVEGDLSVVRSTTAWPLSTAPTSRPPSPRRRRPPPLLDVWCSVVKSTTALSVVKSTTALSVVKSTTAPLELPTAPPS